ncbi:MAG: hypothetical protein R2857_03010 [Vampirovibrionales bacterium]
MMIDADTIEPDKACSVLFANTIAFATCFACWMVYGVLITFLVENGLYRWNASQIGVNWYSGFNGFANASACRNMDGPVWRADYFCRPDAFGCR